MLAPFLAASVAAAEAETAATTGVEEDADDLPGSPVAQARGRRGVLPSLAVHNPSYDYVPPELISLFVTDQGPGFMPSYVYRQLSEFYDRCVLRGGILAGAAGIAGPM